MIEGAQRCVKSVLQKCKSLRLFGDLNLLFFKIFSLADGTPFLADTVLQGNTTSSKNSSDFDVSESSDEQIAKEVDQGTDIDDGDYSNKALTGCLKGRHDFAKGFNSTGKDKERDKGKYFTYIFEVTLVTFYFTFSNCWVLKTCDLPNIAFSSKLGFD